MINKRGITWYKDWETDRVYQGQIIIATAGLIGSGKTFWAKQYVKDHENFVRINKDDIRVQIRKDNHKPEDARVNEDEVVRIESTLILEALAKGKSVILDNTHLNPVHIKERIPQLLNKNNWGKVQILVNASFLDVPLETCMKQNNMRTGIERVDEFVIKNMWKQWKSHWEKRDYWSYLDRLTGFYGLPEEVSSEKVKPAIIFDIDGTLALLGDRGRFEEDKVGLDLVNIPVMNMAKMYLSNPAYQVLFVSGRKAGCRKQTQDWLCNALEVNNVRLYMRPDDDNRSDDLVKEDIYHNDIEPDYFVEAVVDDRLKVCRKWHEMGLFVFNVNQTGEEF